MNACNLGFSYGILYSSGPLYISIFLILPFIAYIAGLIYADWLQSTAAAILGSYLIFLTSLIGSLPTEPLPTSLLIWRGYNERSLRIIMPSPYHIQ